MGQFIASERKKKNMTQKNLADKLYVTDRAVSKWERGLSYPDILLLEKLSEILEVSVSELLNGERMNDIDKGKADDIVKDSIAIYKKDVKKHIFRKITITILSVIICAIILLISILGITSKFGRISYESYKNRDITKASLTTSNAFIKAVQNKDIATINELTEDYFTEIDPENKEENQTKYNQYLQDFFENYTITKIEYGYNTTNYGKLITHEYTLFLDYHGQSIMHYIQLRSNEKQVYLAAIGYEDDDQISMNFIEKNPEVWKLVERVFSDFRIHESLSL